MSLGQSGTYGGYNNDETNLLHWEVFSNDNFVDSFPSPNGEIHLIDYDKTRDLGMCNRRDMIDMFHNEAAYESDIARLVYLEDDGIITKKEMETFYASPLSNNLREYICQHRSEWAEGIASKGIWLWLKEKLSMDSLDNLQDFVKYVYDPYKWLDDEMVSNMNSSETNHLQKGCATYYNPIRLLEWLYDKDERIIMEFTE